MKRKHFRKLKEGEVVIIVAKGKNNGKKGIVREVVLDHFENGGGIAYLEPLNCVFEFVDEQRSLRNRNGLYGWNCLSIKYEKEPWDKQFYIGRMFGADDIKWCADGFTEHELSIIDKFLTQFNEHASGVYIDSVCILDCEED